MKPIHPYLISLTLSLLWLSTGSSPAVIPVSGRPVPALSAFDTEMKDLMEANNLEAGVLGVMRNGVIVYLRGFGSLDAGVNMPENAIVRLASCTKPVTAAAIRYRIADGALAENQKAFLQNGNGGALNLASFPSWGSANYGNITVLHLLRHAGGWDRNTEQLSDLTYRERTVSQDMGLIGAPGRTNVLRWVTGHSLWFVPGTQSRYSNEGYLALGLMVAGNTASHLSFLRNRVFQPALWVPSTEVIQARTARANRDPREPWYRTDFTSPDASDPSGDAATLNNAYGGLITLEARLGQGGLCASAAAMLELGNTYHINTGSVSGAGRSIGIPIDAASPQTAAEAHNGGLPGVNTMLWHRTDGVVAFAFFNRNAGDDRNTHYGIQIRSTLDAIMNGMAPGDWPTASSDGFWVLPTSALPDTGLGGYHSPWRGFGAAVAKAKDHSRLRLKAGTTSWTGAITKRIRLDAPLGQVRIGFP